MAKRHGNFFEDYEIGQVFQHPLGRTISQTDNTWFTLLTQNTHPAHFDAHYAAGTPYGQTLVNSGFTIALVLGQTVSDISQNAMANLELTNVKLTHPVFEGDTLYSESIVTSLKESASRPYAGVVGVHTRAVNQDGDVCLSFDRKVMVFRGDSEFARSSFPQAKSGPLTSDDT